MTSFDNLRRARMWWVLGAGLTIAAWVVPARMLGVPGPLVGLGTGAIIVAWWEIRP